MSELVKSENQNSMQVFNSVDNFETALRMAKCLTSSNIVPAIYQDKEKGLSNCIIALEMANRIKMSPLMVMQNLYIVYGNIGWSSKFLIAAWNTSGRYTTIRYEFEGIKDTDKWGCRAVSTEKATGVELKSALITIDIAKKEGWYDKKGSKWQTMPELMLQYRAATFLVRAYAPEISMGMQTQEEIEDVIQDVNFEEVQNEIDSKANTNHLNIPLPEANKINQEPQKEKPQKEKPQKEEPQKEEPQEEKVDVKKVSPTTNQQAQKMPDIFTQQKAK